MTLIRIACLAVGALTLTPLPGAAEDCRTFNDELDVCATFQMQDYSSEAKFTVIISNKTSRPITIGHLSVRLDSKIWLTRIANPETADSANAQTRERLQRLYLCPEAGNGTVNCWDKGLVIIDGSRNETFTATVPASQLDYSLINVFSGGQQLSHNLLVKYATDEDKREDEYLSVTGPVEPPLWTIFPGALAGVFLWLLIRVLLRLRRSSVRVAWRRAETDLRQVVLPSMVLVPVILWLIRVLDANNALFAGFTAPAQDFGGGVVWGLILTGLSSDKLSRLFDILIPDAVEEEAPGGTPSETLARPKARSAANAG